MAMLLRQLSDGVQQRLSEGPPAEQVGPPTVSQCKAATCCALPQAATGRLLALTQRSDRQLMQGVCLCKVAGCTTSHASTAPHQHLHDTCALGHAAGCASCHPGSASTGGSARAARGWAANADRGRHLSAAAPGTAAAVGAGCAVAAGAAASAAVWGTGAPALHQRHCCQSGEHGCPPGWPCRGRAQGEKNQSK